MNTASGVKMTKVSQNEIPEPVVSFKRQIAPLGLNARRVISKRYSLKDARGASLEEWSDIVARVVAHFSVAETDPEAVLPKRQEGHAHRGNRHPKPLRGLRYSPIDE